MLRIKTMSVALRDCRFFARHGVLPQERRAGNEFEVSMEVSYPVNEPIADRLDGTVSYADLYDLVKSEMAVPADLLETVAERIADAAMERWSQITSLSISITKLTPPIPGFTGTATVTLHSKR